MRCFFFLAGVSQYFYVLDIRKIVPTIFIWTVVLVLCVFFFSYDAESIDGVVKSIELAEHEISSTEENLRSAEDVCFYRWLLY